MKVLCFQAGAHRRSDDPPPGGKEQQDETRGGCALGHLGRA